MKKIYIAITFVILVVGGYFFFLHGNKGTANHEFAKGIDMLKGTGKQEYNTEPGDVVESITEMPITGIFEKIKACDHVIERYDEEFICREIKIAYAGAAAFIVNMKGAAKENGIVMPDGRIVPLQTDLYYKPFESMKDYVLKRDGVDISESDFEEAEKELRIGKRGYLYSAKFVGEKEGTLYITPQGKLSGHLKVKE